MQTVACARGQKFDPSPKVCACVPPPVCGAVCDIYCAYGNVLDPTTGCPTCRCNPAPTK